MPNEDVPDLQPGASLSDVMSFLRNGVVLAVIVGCLAGALAYVISRHMKPVYRATAVLVSDQSGQSQNPLGVPLVTAPPLAISTYTAALTSRPVLESALARVGVKPVASSTIAMARRHVRVGTKLDKPSSLIEISDYNSDAAMAADMANALAGALVDWDRQRASQYLQDVIQTLKGQIAALEAEIARVKGKAGPASLPNGLSNLLAQRTLQLSSAQALQSAALGNLQVMEAAVTPSSPRSPRPLHNSAIAFGLGVLLEYALLLAKEAISPRFRDPQDLARSTALPVLAEFPDMVGEVSRYPVEIANYLRANLAPVVTRQRPSVILITSAKTGDGKTSVAISLAESYARDHRRTLLIDGNLRNPAVVAEYHFDRRVTPSFKHYLEGRRKLAPAAVEVRGGTMHVIPTFSTPPSPSDLLSAGFAEFIGELRAYYDVVIIDSPAVLSVADALIMAPHATGVVLCTNLAGGDRRNVAFALASIDRVGGKMLGLVATRVRNARTGRRSFGTPYESQGSEYWSDASSRGSKGIDRRRTGRLSSLALEPGGTLNRVRQGDESEVD